MSFFEPLLGNALRAAQRLLAFASVGLEEMP